MEDIIAHPTAIVTCGLQAKYLTALGLSRGVMTSIGLDSTASFKARALEMGMSEALYNLLKDNGVSTYGAFAFICPYTPGQGDETVLMDATEAVIRRVLTAAEKIVVRRLFFESHTMALADLKQRFEREDTAEPTRLPMPERIARLEAQKVRLPGLHYSSETEPSHKLVDTVFQMIPDQQISWLPWEKPTNRASESLSSKKDLQITFDASGALKLSKGQNDQVGAISGEIQVRQALQRRARAFDLAHICSYQVMEAWHERLFEVLQREPPANCSRVTMQQAKDADRMLWKKLAEQTRGSVAQQPDGSKPVEAALTMLSLDPEVNFLMMPGPRSNRPGPYDDPKKVKKGKGGKGDKDDKGKGKGSGGPPEGCHQKTPQDKPMCFAYNRGFCKFASDGKRCKRGFHVCWKCFKPQPFHSCQH